jgi:nucleoside-diphosphate-sugar epimerase
MGSKETILVTGSTGFIGSHLVPVLISEGYNVVCTSTRVENAANYSWFSEVEFVPYCFEEFDSCANYFDFFGRPDRVIHLAWPDLPDYRSLNHIEKTLFLQYQFCKNLLINGLTDITITGTCMEYGMQQGGLSEDQPVFPSNSYALAKHTLFNFINLLKVDFGFNFKWLRLFYTYGPGQHRSSLYSQLMAAILKGDTQFNMSPGDQMRDFLPIETLVRYVTKVACQKEIDGIINICSNKPVTVRQLVEQILKEKEYKMELNTGYYPYSPLEPMHFWGNNQKLNKILTNE